MDGGQFDHEEDIWVNENPRINTNSDCSYCGHLKRNNSIILKWSGLWVKCMKKTNRWLINLNESTYNPKQRFLQAA